MSKNVIFCYSGSGNCLDMAKNMAKEMGDTDIIMMRSRPVKTDVRDAERVGFIFPCYGGGMPGNFEEYVKAVRVAPTAYVFGIVQFAGYPGCGLRKLDNIIRLDYWGMMSHHCSCVWLLPHGLMMPPLSVAKAQARSEKKAKAFAADVMAGVRSGKRPPAMSVNVPEAAVWPHLAKKKAKKLEASDACISCGQCAKLCPQGNITLLGGKPEFGTECIGCLSCLQYCPKGAISLGAITDKREHYHNANVAPAELMQELIHID